MKTFKTFLLESEGIYDTMRDSIEDRLRYEHRKRHENGQIPEPEMKREHIKQYGLHHGLLDQVPGRSRIEHDDFDDIFAEFGDIFSNGRCIYRKITTASRLYNCLILTARVVPTLTQRAP